MSVSEALEAAKGFGGYTTTGVVLLMWWKGLPGLLQALERLVTVFTERNAKIAATFDAQVKRLEEQLKAADARYEARDHECQQRVSDMQERIDALETEIAGMRRQERQRALSARDIMGQTSLPPAIAPLIQALDKLPED